MAENSNIIITVTADDSGAISKIEKLGQTINATGAASQSWIGQLAELKTQLGQLDPKSAEWAKLALQYKELGGSAKVVSQSLEELKGQAENAASGQSSLRQQLADVRRELDKGKEALGTDAYSALIAKAGDLQGQIAKTSDEIKNTAAPAFKGFGGNVDELKSKFGSLNFKGAGNELKSLSENVKSFKFSSLTDGIKSAKDGFVSFGKALLANPLFLLGQVILTIVTNFEAIKNAVPPVAAVFKVIEKVVGAVKDAIFGFTDAIGLTQKASIDAIDAAYGSLEKRGKDLDNARREAVAQAKKTGGDVEQVNKDFEAKRIADLEAAIATSKQLRGKETEQQKTDREKAEGELKEIHIKRIEAEADADEKARNDAAAAAEKAARDAEAEAQRQAALAKQRAAERAAREKEVTDAIKAAQEERYQNTLTDEEREIRQNELKYNALLEKAGQNATLRAQIETDRLLAEQNIRDKFAQVELENEAKKQAEIQKLLRDNENERLNELETLTEQEFQAGLSAKEREKIALRDSLNAQIETLKANGESSTNLQKQLDDGLAAIDKKYIDEAAAATDAANKAEEDKAKAIKDSRIQNAQNGLNVLLALNDAFAGKSEKAQKAAFNRNKAIQIAQASINTYQSATAAYGSQLVVGDVTSPVRATIAAAIAVAAGLANVAKIAKTTFSSPAPSAGGSGGGGGGDLASTGVATTGGAPEFNPLATMAIQNQPMQVTPAYVLASDIASSMEARAKVTDLSRL
jgi:hypothetical protein